MSRFNFIPANIGHPLGGALLFAIALPLWAEEPAPAMAPTWQIAPPVKQQTQPQAQSQPRLGAVDMEAVMRGSKPGKKLLAELESLVEEKRREALALEKEAQDIRAQAVELAPKASQQQLNDLQRKFNDKREDLRRLQEEANRDIGEKRIEVLSAFNRLAMPLVQKMGKEGGYTMLFRKVESGLLYVDEAADLTDEVIRRLDGGR